LPLKELTSNAANAEAKRPPNTTLQEDILFICPFVHILHNPTLGIAQKGNYCLRFFLTLHHSLYKLQEAHVDSDSCTEIRVPEPHDPVSGGYPE
jgi:hypothetical protein